MRNIFAYISLILLLTISVGFSSKNNDNNNFYAETESSRHWIDSVFKSLSPKERLMQLFIIHAYSNKNENYNQKLINTIKKYKPGGIIFFQGDPKKPGPTDKQTTGFK